VQALAIALAASLLLGPAPASSTPASEPSPSEPDGSPAVEAPPRELPDVDGPATDPVPAPSEVSPEPAPAPETAPSPAPETVTETVTETASPPAPTLTSTDDPPEPLAVAPTRDRLGCAGKPACRRMTIAGIVVGTLGLAAVGTGIGLLVTPDEVIPERPTFVTSTRPAGLVTLTLGAGVTLTAVLMLIAAHKGYKQRGEQARVVPFAGGLRF
jgi:hypothetical protein